MPTEWPPTGPITKSDDREICGVCGEYLADCECDGTEPVHVIEELSATLSRRTELLREAATRLTREADAWHDRKACADLASRIRKELGDA